NLASYDDGTTSATYTYDALGQKLSETVDYGAFTVSHSYEYYANGLKKSFTGPDGVKITYSYDENNRLSAIDIPNAGRVTYNTYHWNRPAKITLPGGSQIDLAYDPLMRLLSKVVKDPAQQFLMDYEYEHSPANNITKKTTEQGEYAYQYDELSRLTQATNPVLEDEHYTYDLLSNRLTASGVEGSYDANNALLSYGDVEFEYDASGNVVKKTDGSQVTHYEYNVEGRLVRVTDSEDNLIAEYDYDPLGRRIWKEVEGVRTYFVYAAYGLIGEYDDSGVEIKGYGYLPDSMWTTNPLFHKTNGSYYWYQNDHLGTPQKLLDSQGNVVWAAVYEAFGKARVDVNLVENHLRFAGQYFDSETGLHYNWHRYYEPTTGRYLRVDPIPSVNLYAYVLGNPVSFVDPFGLEATEWLDFVQLGLMYGGNGEPINLSFPNFFYIYFGCSCGIPSDVIENARSETRNWSLYGDRTDVHRSFTGGRDKCNLFVDTMYENSGYILPNIGGNWYSIPFHRFPPGAGNASDPNYEIPGWPVVLNPAPGDFAAFKGHVGIVTTKGLTISASSENSVVENNWGFRSHQNTVFRRCLCQ
ncbi:MAG TPA: hypothetical protein ENF37_01930, partial [Beggiatoa sp.]|nr:hypothetical protein [Beggiatoa sp.]